MFFDNTFTTKEIAEDLGISINIAQDWAKAHGVDKDSIQYRWSWDDYCDFLEQIISYDDSEELVNIQQRLENLIKKSIFR